MMVQRWRRSRISSATCGRWRKPSSFEASRDQADRKGFIFRVKSWADVGIRTPEGFDLAAGPAAVCKMLEVVRGHLERNRGRYEKPGFRAKADPDTVAEIAEKIDELTTQS